MIGKFGSALSLMLLCCGMPSHAQVMTIAELEAKIGSGEMARISAIEAEQHGVSTYSQRFDGKDDARLVDIKSAGKSITALAVGAAIADGKLTTQTPVWPLLGSAPDDPRNAITVRDLLTMSSALDCNDWDRKSPGQEEKMYRTREWRTFAMNLPLAADYTRDADGYGRFSYCTAGVFLLGQVVEEVTGERFDAYVARKIFTPLGIADAEWRQSKSGEIQSGGQLKMRAKDLLLIGRLMLDRGRLGDQQIIDSAWIDEMLTPRRQLGDHVHYGYLWWFTLVKSPRGFEPSWMMKGNGGNIVSIYREYDAVIVVQSRNYNRKNAEENSFQALWTVIAEMEQPEGMPFARPAE